MISIPPWLIISFVLLIIMIILFRTANQVFLLSLLKNNAFYIIVFGLFIFLAISLITINKNNPNLDFTSARGIGQVGKIYFSWFVNVLSNMGKVTGYAVQQDWFNSSNTTS